MMRRRATSAAAILCCGLSFAQSARWEAEVPLVAAKGLHAIALSPELVGASRSDLGDIRLLDSAGHDVPFLIREVIEPSRPDRFEPYTLLRNEALRYRTVLELERPVAQELEELHIWIRPTQVQKHVRVTGSDDRRDWFMVKDDHVVAQGAHGDPPHQVLRVVIPRSDYRYLRITLNDSLTPPMKVLGVGRFIDGSSRVPRFTVPEPLQYVQVDSGSVSLLRIARSKPLLIERIGFTVSDTGAYRRNGRIITRSREVTGRGRKRRTVRYEEHRGSFVLASDGVHHTDIDPLRADSLEIVIDNGDDRPLRITGLWAASRQHVLLAHLDPGMPYVLTTGNTLLDAPRYDIAHFADELPAPLDSLSHGALRAIPIDASIGPALNPSSRWVWAAIILLMLGMAWMAVRMLRGTR